MGTKRKEKMSRNNTLHIKVSATKKQNVLERGFYSSPVIQENYLAVSAFSFFILPIALILNAIFVGGCSQNKEVANKSK